MDPVEKLFLENIVDCQGKILQLWKVINMFKFQHRNQLPTFSQMENFYGTLMINFGKLSSNEIFRSLNYVIDDETVCWSVIENSSDFSYKIRLIIFLVKEQAEKFILNQPCPHTYEIQEMKLGPFHTRHVECSLRLFGHFRI